MKQTFEYTFDDVRIDARCWFDMYVGNDFFAMHCEFIFVVNGVSNIIFVFVFYAILDSWVLFAIKFFENIHIIMP